MTKTIPRVASSEYLPLLLLLQVCGERLGFAPHTINPQRLIAIPRHGDYVIDGTPRMCTKVILNITYTADGYYGQLAPSGET